MLKIINPDYPVLLQEKEGEEQLLCSYFEKYSSIHIICDSNTEKCCLPLFKAVLADFDYKLHVFPAGEQNKSAETLHNLYKALLNCKADRNALLINLGGGVVGDLGGFLAATYKRGIDFIQVPTSLLAMVDATIGGKLGYNFNGIKNSIGCFANPLAVWINPVFLKTLGKAERISGWAEMLKHALIADKSHWKALCAFDILKEKIIPVDFIAKSLEIKLEIVKADPFEKGLRKILNLGHTIGHALESIALERKTALPHGVAVALGILAESYCAVKMELLSATDFDELEKYIWPIYGKYLPDKIDLQNVLQFIENDKKNTSGQFNFTLLRKIGEAKYNQSLNIEYIEELVKWLNSKA
ncbi:MAG: 3-dehydroquinate synthase [Chitinophagales bacterium]